MSAEAVRNLTTAEAYTVASIALGVIAEKEAKEGRPGNALAAGMAQEIANIYAVRYAD